MTTPAPKSRGGRGRSRIVSSANPELECTIAEKFGASHLSLPSTPATPIGSGAPATTVNARLNDSFGLGSSSAVPVTNLLFSPMGAWPPSAASAGSGFGVGSSVATAAHSPFLNSQVHLISRVYAKVGSGRYCLMEQPWHALVHLDAAALLVHLSQNKFFQSKMSSLLLDECSVAIVPSVANCKSGSTPAEEAVALPFDLMSTVGDLAASRTTGDLLFIHVRLPNFRPPGILAYSPASGISERVWITLPQEVQELAHRASHERTSLASVGALKKLQELRSVAPIDEDGITALHAEAEGALQLGVTKLPSVSSSFASTSKGFNYSRDGQTFILQETRVKIAAEFVDAMKSERRHGFGVLLSGPNGVGKSSCGLLAYLTCVAQSLTVVYIPNARAWTQAAMKGDGDKFFLKLLLTLNADLIAKEPRLLRAFLPNFAGEEELGSATMARLADILNHDDSLKIGVIVDEVQVITNLVEGDSAADSETRAAVVYFHSGWYNWQGEPGRLFVRMDIASSHGLREYKLPSGEEDRVRYIPAWSEPVRDAFLSSPSSPGYICDPVARAHAKYIAGGVVRTLFRVRNMMLESGVGKNERKDIEARMRAVMMNDCKRWIAQLKRDDDLELARKMITFFFRGHSNLSAFKPVYDAGLVTSNASGSQLTPTSPLAASVLHELLAAATGDVRKSLSTISNPVERGYELERQLHICLDCCAKSITTYSLSGVKGDELLPIGTKKAGTFNVIADTVPLDGTSVLYIPLSDQYPVDTIIMPEDGLPDWPIVLLECSVTSPRTSERVEKVKKWFKAEGLIAQVQKTHPRRSIVCALAWHSVMTPAGPREEKYKELDEEAAQVTEKMAVADAGTIIQPRTVVVRVIDNVGLLELGVMV